MKNKLVYLIFILLFITGCSKNDSVSDIVFSKLDDCNHKPQLLMKKADMNIYTYCINDVMVTVNKKQFDLKEYINSNEKSIEKIIEILNIDDIAYDGGTKIYRGNNITLVKCNTLDGNHDVYIGNLDMKYKSNFCKENNHTFIRTYTIESIREYKEQQYENGIPVTYTNSFEVKLKDYKEIEDVVIINNFWPVNLEKNKTYEFEFMLYENSSNIEDNAQYIFKNSQIVEVRETNEVGLDQVNEKIK